ncbi:hypothetical protein MKX01_032168 [Papaver californicum]|nr:hypothetical protein MKX01_032168 [Papaver californicum]
MLVEGCEAFVSSSLHRVVTFHLSEISLSLKLHLLISRNFGAVSTPNPLRSSRIHLHFLVKRFSSKIQMENGASDNPRGALVVLEGLDRSGKTSQASGLLSYLEGQGLSAELWRFPDRNTCVGQMISSYLSNKSELDDRSIHLLFSANRCCCMYTYKPLSFHCMQLHFPSTSILGTKLSSYQVLLFLVKSIYGYAGICQHDDQTEGDKPNKNKEVENAWSLKEAPLRY